MPASFTDTIIQWGSQGLSNEKIKPPITPNQ